MTRHSRHHGVSQSLQRLDSYPAGTWIVIGDRRFYRPAVGSCWREDDPDLDFHPSRTSLFIRNIELISNERHRIVRRR